MDEFFLQLCSHTDYTHEVVWHPVQDDSLTILHPYYYLLRIISISHQSRKLKLPCYIKKGIVVLTSSQSISNWLFQSISNWLFQFMFCSLDSVKRRVDNKTSTMKHVYNTNYMELQLVLRALEHRAVEY